jgi:hypothetical protein
LFIVSRGRRGGDGIVVEYTPMQSVPINTKVVNLNNMCGEWYLFLSVEVIATIYASKVTEIESNRICGIVLIFPGEPSIIFLSVYLPAVTQSYEMFSREIEYRLCSKYILMCAYIVLRHFYNPINKMK